MDYAALLENIAADLLEYGEYDTSVNGIAANALFSAAQEWYDRRPWSFKWSTTTISTTDDNRGPYDLPADFDAMVNEERLSTPNSYDILAVSVIADSNYKQIQVRLDRANTKLYFVDDPGTADYTFRYAVAMTDVTSLTSWPQKLASALKELAKGYILQNSEDTKERGDYFLNRGELLMRRAWNGIRRGHSLQQQREPRDIYGQPLHYAIDMDD